MSRSLTRELAMQLIFQMGIQNDFGADIRERFLKDHEISKQDRDFIMNICDAIEKNLADIDGLINECSAGWTTSRMAKVDLAIARLAVTEIIYTKETPLPVVINEAVELAKKYGGDSSPKFLNGLLGKLARTKAEPRKAHSEQTIAVGEGTDEKQ